MTPPGADGDLFLMTAAVFAGVAMVVAALLLVFAGEGSSRARRLGRRLEALRKRGEAAGRAARSAPGASSSIKLSESKSRIPGAEWLGRLMPRREMLTRRFSRTGFRISLGTYALASVAVAALSTFVEIEFMHMPLAVGVIGGIGAGIGIPHGFVGYLIGRRTRKFLAYFPEAIELIVRGIKSGLPISEEINAVGREIADPVGYEFRQVADGLRLGQTMEESMWDAAKRLDIADFNFFVISLSVQRETGGNLAETLENLSDVLRKRRQMKLKVHAMSSEARASAMIIGSLPFIMLGILVIMAPAYVGMLFTDPRGQMVTIGAALLMACGVLVMAKMVRFEI